MAWRRAGTITLFVVPAGQATLAGEIDTLESIPGLLKRLQIRALDIPLYTISQWIDCMTRKLCNVMVII